MYIQNGKNRTRYILYLFLSIGILIATYYWNLVSDPQKGVAGDYPIDTLTLTNGKSLFDKNCASCHTIREEAIGPPLGGITTLFSPTSLISYILNPQYGIPGAEARTKYLQDRYRAAMPPFRHLDEQQISSILAYLSRQKVAPLIIDLRQPINQEERLAPSVKRSGLYIEWEDFLQFPRLENHPPDKGIATLRPHPAADGSLFVSDQIGILYHVNHGRITSFLSIRDYVDHFIHEPGIGTGLGSFDLHPGFLENGLLYTTHAEAYTGKPAINDGAFPDTVGVGLQWILSEWTVDVVSGSIRKGGRREVLRLNTPTTAHGVQDIAFAPGLDKSDPDYGLLYLGIGDGGSNNIKRPELADQKRSLLGAILRIDPRGKNSPTGQYGIPPDNPFVGDRDPGVRKEIWAYGFRNPHRMCWDMTFKKRLLVADIGEANIEEINLVEKGENYGWSTMEGNYGINTRVDAKVVYPVKSDKPALLRTPFGQFDHTDGKAVSGGFVYQGPLSHLTGKYIFGDIVTGKLFFMNMNQELSDSTVYEISLRQNGRETSLKEIIQTNRVHLRIGYDHYAGQLFILTKGDGMIRRVTRAYYVDDAEQ